MPARPCSRGQGTARGPPSRPALQLLPTAASSGLLSPLSSAAEALMAKRRSSCVDGTFARARMSLFPARPQHPRQRTSPSAGTGAEGLCSCAAERSDRAIAKSFFLRRTLGKFSPHSGGLAIAGAPAHHAQVCPQRLEVADPAEVKAPLVVGDHCAERLEEVAVVIADMVEDNLARLL